MGTEVEGDNTAAAVAAGVHYHIDSSEAVEAEVDSAAAEEVEGTAAEVLPEQNLRHNTLQHRHSLVGLQTLLTILIFL